MFMHLQLIFSTQRSKIEEKQKKVNLCFVQCRSSSRGGGGGYSLYSDDRDDCRIF